MQGFHFCVLITANSFWSLISLQFFHGRLKFGLCFVKLARIGTIGKFQIFSFLGRLVVSKCLELDKKIKDVNILRKLTSQSNATP